MTTLTATKQETYDVVIMGAGLAGVCQARHLMLNVPGIKVALIDPRPEDRHPVKDLKIGESTVEIAALFLAKDLGLYEYLIENHAPKHGLNFHWPKDTKVTEKISDYYQIWTNRNPPLPSFQINRPKFERDVLRMNLEMGANFYNGRVVDVDLTSGEELHLVTVKTKQEKLQLTAKHVVDAAGRKFIIGRKKDNLLFGSENLLGLNNGAAWMRVKNVDRTIFHDGYDPYTASCSHYYGTNHFFGHGHWLWMIPTEPNSQEVSIGMMHHHEQLPASEINTQEKFLNFLKANHTVLYNLIQSGEPEDFHYWKRTAHSSKMMFSPDNWYVIGDAAYIFDAFYSYGSSTVAFAVESVTEIIKAKLAKAEDAEQKRDAYNQFNLAYTRLVNSVYRGHDRQLGHASVMSWRIYFEYMWWFSIQIPLFIGKWHLDSSFVKTFLPVADYIVDEIFFDLCQDFQYLVDKDVNLGLLHCYQSNELFGNYNTVNHYDDFTENAKYEPLHCNVFAGLKATGFYAAIWLIKFQWKGFGWQGLLKRKTFYHVFRLLVLSIQATIGEFIYKFQTRSIPKNTEIAKMRQEFKNYRYKAQLQPWEAEPSLTTACDSKPEHSLV
jgi:flavin-dependent dehydrogenase